MSVIKCAERPDKRTASERDDGTRVYTRTYYVETDSKYDDAIVVLAYSGLPALFSKYQTGTTSDLGAYCIGRDPQQIGAKNWDVVITNDSKQEAQDSGGGGGGGGGGGNQQTDPEKWFSTVGYVFEKSQKPTPFSRKLPTGVYVPGGGASQDVYYAITNAAGEPYDPVPMMDVYYPILTFNTFVKNFNDTYAKSYINAVNQDVFFGATPGQWHLTAFETQGMAYKKIGNIDVWYYPVKVEMKFNPDGWAERLLNAGSYYIESTKKKAFLTEEGQPYTGLLTSTGGKLSSGASPTWIVAYQYMQKPFSSIGLPNSMPRTP